MPWPRDSVLEIATRRRPDVTGPDIGPCAALVVGLACSPTGRAVGFGRDVQSLVVAAKTVDGEFDRALAWLDHTGAAYAGNAACVFRAWRHAVFEPANRDRVVSPWIDKGPCFAAIVAFTAGGTDRRIAGANLELLIIAAAAIEAALRKRLASQSHHRQCERGPKPCRNLHARPPEFESRLACPVHMLTHRPRLRSYGQLPRKFCANKIERPPEGPAGAGSGRERGCSRMSDRAAG